MSTATMPETRHLVYNIASKDGDPTSVTVFMSDGSTLVAQPSHPGFKEICEMLRSGSVDTDALLAAFDVVKAIEGKFQRVSDRVMVQGRKLLFDGDVIDNALTRTIVRYMAEGNKDYMPLIHFMEKISLNPNPHSREHLFRWAAHHNFGISPDGDLIAYKGLNSDSTSVTAGTAFVNGEVIRGNIPNKPGTVIEMPRSDVMFDSRVGCATGLHVGNHRYASTFGTKTIRVAVNPRDVVSVPTDSHDEKMRVCRYKVLETDGSHLDLRVLFNDSAMLRITAVEEPVASESVEPVEPAKPRKRAAAVKKSAAKKAAPVKSATKKSAPIKKTKLVRTPLPTVKGEPKKYYEDFKSSDFGKLTMDKLRWLAKEWEVSTNLTPAQATKFNIKTKVGLAAALGVVATKRRRAAAK